MNRSTIDFGIDLGTTNSAIAVLRGVEAEIIKNDLDQDITPSAVSYDKKGALYVGMRAKNRVISKPYDAFLEFKRRMGSEFSYAFKESGLLRKPEELSAEVLKSLRSDVSGKTGEEIRSAVITVPAAFELHQCDATRKAGEMAGLISCPLVQEPVAAALAYGFQVDSEKAYWLVYDFGGGTFDSALIKAEEGLINVVHHGGDNFLGGSDIDWAIIEKIIIPKLTGSYNLPDFNRGNELRWGHALRKLKWFIEAAKIDLSTKTTTSLLDCTFEDADGTEIDGSEISITQNELISVAEPIINRSIDICQQVLKKKNLPASAVQKVILVGGPTKAPYFREMLGNGLGIAIEHSVDPLTVVARGAAVFAGTQKIDARLRPVAQAGEFTIDLKYKPVGYDTEPLIGGKVAALDNSSVEGFTLEFVNAKTQWRSGKISLRADGAFVANLLAEKGDRNIFTIELHDASGLKQNAVPDQLSYTVGAVVEEQPLINSLGVALGDNEVDWFFEKGAGLPLKKKSPYPFRILTGITAGGEGTGVRIPVVEGENDLADRNRLVGHLDIKSDWVKRDLPRGCEIELTLKIDESRIVTVNAYIPVLDEDFETQLDPRKKSALVAEILLEHEQELKRLQSLIGKARRVNDKTAGAQLEKIHSSALLEELRGVMAAAQGDPDAAEKGQRRLLELKLKLDEVENKMKWPTLVTEMRNLTVELRKFVGLANSLEFKNQAAQLEKEVEAIIANEEVDRLERKRTQMRALVFRTLHTLPQFWVERFQRFERARANFSDQEKARRLLEMGRNYLAQNNIQGLKNIVNELVGLLPKRITDEIQRGYGATIVR